MFDLKNDYPHKDELWNSKLQTCLYEVKHDEEQNAVMLVCSGPVDAEGAIELAKQHDPRVKIVAAYIGEKLDAVYKLTDGEWA